MLRLNVYRLGIQRLEEQGVLQLAHQAMLEEMLRDEWTGVDNRGVALADDVAPKMPWFIVFV